MSLEKKLSWDTFKRIDLYPKICWIPKSSEKVTLAVGSTNKKEGACFFLGDFDTLSTEKSLLVAPEERCSIEKKSIPFLENFHRPFYQKRVDLPTLAQWQSTIAHALKLIQQQNMDKVVLARKTLLYYEKEIDPWELFLALKQKSTERDTLFCIEYTKGEAFLGATPEMLFTREGCQLTTMALAGTSPITEDSYHLLHSKKDKQEVEHVVDFLIKTLLPISTTINLSPLEVLKSARVQHLCHHLQAKLKPTITDQMLLKKLHPTPALGGSPKKSSLAFIKKHELFTRGFYGAPVGWLSEERSDLFVAIRSCKVSKNTVELFAGTGIVEGSDPTLEWDELEHKISLLLELLT